MDHGKSTSWLSPWQAQESLCVTQTPDQPETLLSGILGPMSRTPLTFRSSSQILCQPRQDLNLGSGKKKKKKTQPPM